ncbi:T9SS type B sorting domain-containing protein [Dyadobacter luticola]|uniref:Gliding motility-associated C-terminal domain-containing protein n=1 Tax=Dyadobacter luticola TaxID=1979387 RepID=A0A5R9KVF6_9BACT|nr:gliding motility-associated C-terminal domain-containing protein [Dyadobacter luticola]TLV00130.1 gliding motility-associated C-terminal domain-containing protein [Dyadobacter luticola]
MNIRLLIAFLLSIVLFVHENASAQFCGTTGAFSITPTEGCAPLTVKVSNLKPKSESVAYAFNFDKKRDTPPAYNEVSTDSSFTYQLPGTYTILQFGSVGGTGFSQCKDVLVKEVRGPKAQITTCQNGLIQLEIQNDSIAGAYDYLTIDWGDGTQQIFTPGASGSLFLQHAYPTTAPRPDIKITGGYKDDSCQSSLKTTTLTSQTASDQLKDIRIRSVEMLPTGEAKILYQGIDKVPTEVLIDKGDGQFVGTGKSGQTAGAQSVTIGGLNPAQVYRFRLASKDFCDNVMESPIVSSMIIKEGAFGLDEIISVSWEHQPNTEKLLEYQLKRDGVVIFSSADQLSYLDKDVKCGTTYKYEIVAIIENDVRSYSAPVSLEPKTSTPSDVGEASVTVKDESTIATTVELTGEGLTSTYNLIVERAVLGNSDFSQISPPGNGSLQFDDTNVNTNQNSYCYRFKYKNACNLTSPDYSPPVCSILLKSGTAEIFWNADQPFTEAVDAYDLFVLDDSGNTQDIIPKQTSTSHTLDLGSETEFSFQIEAKDAGGRFLSRSNILKIRREPIILIPDAFTPNGDAYNERFEIKAYFISEFKMSVFNRWGEVVFNTSNLTDSWDGKIDSKEAAGGYYIYKIEAIDASGQAVSKSGSFMLIR